MLIKKADSMIALQLVMLLGLYAIAVWPALDGVFLFDDFPNLKNLSIIGDELNLLRIGQYLAEFTGSPGRPISALSFLINDHAWPSDPFSFKYTNLLIHLLNGVLLFGLLRQLTKASPNLPQNIFWPLIAMAAWLFHPLQLSTQMLVVQRMTLLSALFSFAGLWAYIFLLQKSKTLWMAFLAAAALGIATVLAFLSKESGALLPLFAWVLNTTLLQNLLERKHKPVQRLIFISCALPSMLLCVGIFYIAFQPYAYISREFNMTERILTQTHVLSDYVVQIIMPRLSGSGIYFDDYKITRSLFNPISTLLYCLSITASIILALIFRKRFVLVSFAILWFFAGHLMESTILPLELYFEHRNYIPLLGLIIAITASPFFVKADLKKIAGVLLTIWLGLIGTITSLQAPVWGNTSLMARYWASENPNSLRATQELARYYYEHNDPQSAFDTLMGGYTKGIHYADLPLGALLTKCYIPNIRFDGNILEIAYKSVNTSPFTNASFEALSNLRMAVSSNICNDLINNEKWLKLSELFLKNSKFSNSRIRIERGIFFIANNNFELTIYELEQAYIAMPSVELSRKIAEVFHSAGLNDEAETWLKKGLKLKQPYFDALMYNPKVESIALLKQLELDKANAKQSVKE